MDVHHGLGDALGDLKHAEWQPLPIPSERASLMTETLGRGYVLTDP